MHQDAENNIIKLALDLLLKKSKRKYNNLNKKKFFYEQERQYGKEFCVCWSICGTTMNDQVQFSLYWNRC